MAQCHWHKNDNFQIRLADAKDKANMKEYKDKLVQQLDQSVLKFLRHVYHCPNL